MGRGELQTGVSCAIVRESGHLENLRLDRRITWKWMFNKSFEGCKFSLFGSGYGQVAGRFL
jgi:hypothetical protein